MKYGVGRMYLFMPALQSRVEDRCKELGEKRGIGRRDGCRSE